MDFPGRKVFKLPNFLLLWTCQIQSKTASNPDLYCHFDAVVEAVLCTGCELGSLGFWQPKRKTDPNIQTEICVQRESVLWLLVPSGSGQLLWSSFGFLSYCSLHRTENIQVLLPTVVIIFSLFVLFLYPWNFP